MLSTVKLPDRLHITDQGINNIQGKEDELYKTQVHVFSPYFVDLFVRRTLALFVEPDTLVVKFSRLKMSLSNKKCSVARKLTKFSQLKQSCHALGILQDSPWLLTLY